MAQIKANARSLFLCVLVTLAGSIFSTKIVAAEGSIDPLQKQLIELRAIVDAKSEELSLLRLETRQKRKFSLNQIGESKANVETQQLVIKKLERKLAENRKFLEKTKQSTSIKDELSLAISELSNYVQQSLPFKRTARLNNLNEMRDQLTTDTITQSRIANKLWSFVEDEFNLTKNHGIYRQIVTIDNEDVLVDVAKIGMMMLYYRNGANEVGTAVKQGSEWEFIALIDEKHMDQVHKLFDSFQKQVRFGEFSLPNSLPYLSIEREL